MGAETEEEEEGGMTVEQSVKHLVCFEFNLKWVRVSTAGTVPDALVAAAVLCPPIAVAVAAAAASATSATSSACSFSSVPLSGRTC